MGERIHEAEPVYCDGCQLRIAPFARREVYGELVYHEDCAPKARVIRPEPFPRQWTKADQAGGC